MAYGEASEIAPTDRIIGSFSEFSVIVYKRTRNIRIAGKIWGAMGREEKEENVIILEENNYESYCAMK